MEASGAGAGRDGEGMTVFNQRFEVILAVLLGVAAIATAFAAYQTSLHDGDALDSFQEAGRLSDAASQQYTEANQNRLEDQQIFLEVEGASLAGDDELAKELLERLGSDELKAAYEQWDPEAEPSPVGSAAYENPVFEEAERLDGEAEAELKAARADDRKGDKYTLVTVILAVALFLFGVASVAGSRRVKLGTTGIGSAILAVSVVLLVIA